MVNKPQENTLMTAAQAQAICNCPDCKTHKPPLEVVPPVPSGPLRLDLGCGTRKQPGFVGVDCRKFDGVDIACNLGVERWPWADGSVDEAHASHMVEHLTPAERIHFVNELCRVLKKGGKATLITPAWSSCRAYGDLTHQWPPISEFWFPYLNAEWRKVNAPHNDAYTCDFDATSGYAMGPSLVGRSQEYVAFALNHYKEAAADIIATVVKR